MSKLQLLQILLRTHFSEDTGWKIYSALGIVGELLVAVINASLKNTKVVL